MRLKLLVFLALAILLSACVQAPQGTNNAAQVNLIVSTNLTDWVIATNGVYSGPVAQFFRIDLKTVPKP